VQLDWKPARLVIGLALVLSGAGCSGINTTQSVSPATFLLPGFFGQASPATPAVSTPISTEPVSLVPLAAGPASASLPQRDSVQSISQAN